MVYALLLLTYDLVSELLQQKHFESHYLAYHRQQAQIP